MEWSDRKKIFIIHGKGRIGGEGDESGGDLDTIVSNTFYGVWCRSMVRKKHQRDAVYGQDFAFDFVNYHEGLAHLSIHTGSDLYLPDFPLDAIPDLYSDVQFLKENDISLIRIDDHHPWTEEIKALLQELVESNLLTAFVLAGPLKGEEQPKSEQHCGADLVYRACIEGTDLATAGLAELRRLAHVQDLHLESDPLALQLSRLIGSGHSKIDMVLRLMDITTMEDISTIMRTTSWDRAVRAYDKALKRVVSKLNNNLVMMEFFRPIPQKYSTPDETMTYMQSRLGLLTLFGPLVRLMTRKDSKIRFIKWLYSLRRSNLLRILVALAPYRPEGEVRINVAAAVEYLTGNIEMDYFFYCYGSFLMTTRNISDTEGLLNLSLLMPYIGTVGDGGHKEAASGKPAENKSFDRKKFERITGLNFLAYAHYLALKVAEFSGLELKKVKKIGN